MERPAVKAVREAILPTVKRLEREAEEAERKANEDVERRMKEEGFEILDLGGDPPLRFPCWTKATREDGCKKKET